jgi:hypothetical protein
LVVVNIGALARHLELKTETTVRGKKRCAKNSLAL